jgi:hypothetical protein
VHLPHPSQKPGGQCASVNKKGRHRAIYLNGDLRPEAEESQRVAAPLALELTGAICRRVRVDFPDLIYL